MLSVHSRECRFCQRQVVCPADGRPGLRAVVHAARFICTAPLEGRRSRVNAECTKVSHETTRCEVLLPFDAVPGQPETQKSSLVGMVHRCALQALHGNSMRTEPYRMMGLCHEVDLQDCYSDD